MVVARIHSPSRLAQIATAYLGNPFNSKEMELEGRVSNYQGYSKAHIYNIIVATEVNLHYKTYCEGFFVFMFPLSCNIIIEMLEHYN